MLIKVKDGNFIESEGIQSVKKRYAFGGHYEIIVSRDTGEEDVVHVSASEQDADTFIGNLAKKINMTKTLPFSYIPPPAPAYPQWQQPWQLPQVWCGGTHT